MLFENLSVFKIVLEIFPTSLILSGIFPTIIIPVWDFSQYKFELLLPSYKGHDDYKCESWDKSYSQSHILQQQIRIFYVLKRYVRRYLKRYIYTIHKGREDYKCESCEG